MKFNGLFIAATFLGLLVSFWNRNDLPGNISYVPEIQHEPVQKATGKLPFDTIYAGVSYQVAPEFDYEIYGLVVSYRHHDGNSRMHMRSNDHLNMLDVCVIWGDNIANSRLDKIDFWNGIFTCNVKTRDQVAWAAFDMFKLSNNHLISDDERIRDQVKAIRIGDQIKVSGYLSSYASEGAGKRGTSTTRLDTGNGACETIYVERFEIVAAAMSPWRNSMYFFLFLFCLNCFFYFKRPYKPY